MKIKIKTSLISLLLVTSLGFSSFGQDIPPALRDFLIQYGKTSSLSRDFIDEQVYKIDEIVVDSFQAMFESPQTIVFNDVYHSKSDTGYIPEYISVEKYCDLIKTHYPEGFQTFTYSPRLIKTKRISKNTSLYEIVIDKYIRIVDFLTDNPPQAYFDPFVELKLSIIDQGNMDYKIIMIEENRDALANHLWTSKVIPQSVKLYGGFAGGNLSFNNIPENVKNLEDKDITENHLGLGLSWDISGNKNFKFGLLAGIELTKVKGEIDITSYSDMIPMVDIDNYPYKRIIKAQRISQQFDYNALSIPVGLHFDYSFNSSWRDIAKNPEFAKKRFPSKRNIRLSMDVGISYNNVSVSNISDNSGIYSYTGKYQIYNPETQDSSTIIVSNQPEYGFYSDTSFSSGDVESSIAKNYISGFARINVSYPLTQNIEVFLGPYINFSLNDINEVDDNFMLSSKLNEVNDVMSLTGTKLSGYGINAGVTFNIKPAKNFYYKYPDMPKPGRTDTDRDRGFTDYSPYQTGRFYIVPNSGIKEKLIAIKNANWLKKPKSIKYRANKTKKIGIKYPKGKSDLESAELTFLKPFGIDIRLTNCPEIENNVNDPALVIPYTKLIDYDYCFENNQIKMDVERLKDFNFIYVTFIGKKSSAARKDVVNKLRKLLKSANNNNQEILIYVSTEIDQPVVLVNFEFDSEGRTSFPVYNMNNKEDFFQKIEREINSNIMDYKDDIHNIENVLKGEFLLGQRLNANRRFVNFDFFMTDAEKAYRIPNYIDESNNSIIQNLILELTRMYCLDVPSDRNQYDVNVYILRNQRIGEIKVPINECNNNIIFY